MSNSLEISVLARLILKGCVLRSMRNDAILNRYENALWIIPTNRKNQYRPREDALDALNGRLKILSPDWLADHDFLLSISRDPFNPSDLDALCHLRKPSVNRDFINRRNWNAAKGLGPKNRPKISAPKNITKDWVMRFRPNKGLCFLKKGRIVHCDDLVEILTEIFLPERAWLALDSFSGVLPDFIVSCENLGGYIDLPLTTNTLVIFSPGVDIEPTVNLLRAIPSAHWIHFGDLDHEGLVIAEKIGQNSGRCVNLYVPSFVGEYVAGARPVKTAWRKDSDASVAALKKTKKRIFQEAFMLDERLHEDFYASVLSQQHKPCC